MTAPGSIPKAAESSGWTYAEIGSSDLCVHFIHIFPLGRWDWGNRAMPPKLCYFSLRRTQYQGYEKGVALVTPSKHIGICPLLSLINRLPVEKRRRVDGHHLPVCPLPLLCSAGRATRSGHRSTTATRRALTTQPMHRPSLSLINLWMGAK